MKKNLHIIIVSILFSLILWISISLSDEYFTTITLPLKVEDFPSGYTSSTPLPKNISFRVKGEGWRLAALNLGGKQEYIISAENDSGYKIINLYNNLTENPWLSSELALIDINPDTFSLMVEKVGRKKVEVKPDVQLTYKPGFGLATETIIEPDSVIVFGPQSIINNLDMIFTKPIKQSDVDSKLDLEVELSDMNGISYDENSVDVILNVQRIVDKNIENIPIEIIDVPQDRNVVLIPNLLSCSIRGGIDIIGKIDSKDIYAYVNYRDVVMDTLGTVSPEVETPENVQVLFVKPERLRYIIKTF